jgi:drug/metabolite transporter (DMT)-like permease
MIPVLVLLAAVGNAGALVMLRKAVMGEPAAASFSLTQLWTLLHRRVWIAGISTLLAASALQATALSIGAVAQVQLIIILELPLTLIFASIVLGGPLHAREWTAVVTMTVGVALLLLPTGEMEVRVRGSPPNDWIWPSRRPRAPRHDRDGELPQLDVRLSPAYFVWND